jgi:serine/threonine protein kinase
VVYKSQRVKDKKLYAVKVVKKQNIICQVGASDAIIREITALRKLNQSSNITHLYRLYEDKENIYMVMELCEGGVLSSNLDKRYTEHQAKQIAI